jgi:hypothetical protein
MLPERRCVSATCDAAKGVDLFTLTPVWDIGKSCVGIVCNVSFDTRHTRHVDVCLSVADGGTQAFGCNKTVNWAAREVATNALNLHVVIIEDRLTAFGLSLLDAEAPCQRSEMEQKVWWELVHSETVIH